MNHSLRNRELVMLLLRRFECEQLPAANELLADVCAGAALSASDTRLLDEMGEDINHVAVLVGSDPDLASLRRCADGLREAILNGAAANSTRSRAAA